MFFDLGKVIYGLVWVYYVIYIWIFEYSYVIVIKVY